MLWRLLLVTILLAFAVTGGLQIRSLRRRRRAWKVQQAQREFHFQRERLEAKFLDYAAATGKPRGLRWVECEWNNQPVFVMDRAENKLAAFVGVTIRFQAIEGGEMEDVPAVKDLRTATGIFHYEEGRWITIGKVLFNLEPDQVVARFKDQFEPVVPPAT